VLGIVNVRITPTRGAGPERVTAVVKRLQRLFDEGSGNASRPLGAGLGSVLLRSVDETEPARLVVAVGPEEISEAGLRQMFTHLAGPGGDHSAFRRLAELTSVLPPDHEWIARSANQADVDALRAAVRAAHLLNTGPSMDTRGFHTPAPSMDATGMATAVPPATLHAVYAPNIPSVFHAEVRTTFPPNAYELGLTEGDMMFAATVVVTHATKVDVPGLPGRQTVAGSFRRTALHVEAVLQDGLVIEVRFTLP
jgi:hypothetical protein